VRRNFLCGLQGREPANLADLNAELRRWVPEVASQRVHGTTHAQVLQRWDEDQVAMQPVNGRLAYPYMDDEQHKVAHDASVAWQGSPETRAARTEGAATQCHGSSRAKRSGCATTIAMSKCATAPNGSPCIPGQGGHIRSLPAANIRRVFHLVSLNVRVRR
jgi:hypothetical protein